MSAILILKRISKEQLRELLAMPVQERREVYLPEDYVSPEDFIDLDKAWHGIHFILTGTIENGLPPSCYLLTDGIVVGPSVLNNSNTDRERILGEIDRALLNEQVKSFSEHLDTISDDEIKQRFFRSIPSMQDVYPGGWKVYPEDYCLYLLDNFNILKSFIRETNESGKDLLIHFS
jgi:hypothetical protein